MLVGCDENLNYDNFLAPPWSVNDGDEDKGAPIELPLPLSLPCYSLTFFLMFLLLVANAIITFSHGHLFLSVGTCQMNYVFFYRIGNSMYLFTQFDSSLTDNIEIQLYVV